MWCCCCGMDRRLLPCTCTVPRVTERPSKLIETDIMATRQAWSVSVTIEEDGKQVVQVTPAASELRCGAEKI